MKLRAAGVITALFVALGSTTYPTPSRHSGLAVAPPAHPRADPVAESSPGGVGPVQPDSQTAPSTPETPQPMQETPPRPTSPDRGAFEERASGDLLAWEKRLGDFTARTHDGSPHERAEAARLNRELTAVKQQLEGLQQATSDDWTVQRKDFEYAFGRFKYHWQTVQTKAAG